MTNIKNNEKTNLISFRPRQKTFEYNGIKIDLPEYVGRNAVRYRFDGDTRKLLKVCLECEKLSPVLHLDEETMSFIDVHSEEEVHYQGKSGFKTRCVECDQKFEIERQQKLKEAFYQEFATEQQLETPDSSDSTLSNLSQENLEFVEIISKKLRMTELEFLNYVVNVYKRHNKYVPVQFEEIIK